MYNLVIALLLSGQVGFYAPDGKTPAVFPTLASCQAVLERQQEEWADKIPEPFALACLKVDEE